MLPEQISIGNNYYILKGEYYEAVDPKGVLANRLKLKYHISELSNLKYEDSTNDLGAASMFGGGFAEKPRNLRRRVRIKRELENPANNHIDITINNV